MRVLFISDVYFPRVNGVSTSIATFRADLAACGVDTTLIVPQYGEAPIASDTASIVRVPSRPVPRDHEDRLMRWGALQRALQALKDQRFDLVHEYGSSHGLTRIIRLAYYEHPSYVMLLRRAYAALVSFLTAVVMPHFLAPEAYGLAAMSAVLFTLGDMFKDFGMTSALMRRGAISQEEVSFLFWFNLLTTFVLAVLLAASSPFVATFFHQPVVAKVILLSLIGFVLTGISLQHRMLLSRDLRFTELAVIDSVAAIAAGWRHRTTPQTISKLSRSPDMRRDLPVGPTFASISAARSKAPSIMSSSAISRRCSRTSSQRSPR